MDGTRQLRRGGSGEAKAREADRATRRTCCAQPLADVVLWSLPDFPSVNSVSCLFACSLSYLVCCCCCCFSFSFRCWQKLKHAFPEALGFLIPLKLLLLTACPCRLRPRSCLQPPLLSPPAFLQPRPASSFLSLSSWQPPGAYILPALLFLLKL